jgi:hypothetical protein
MGTVPRGPGMRLSRIQGPQLPQMMETTNSGMTQWKLRKSYLLMERRWTLSCFSKMGPLLNLTGIDLCSVLSPCCPSLGHQPMTLGMTAGWDVSGTRTSGSNISHSTSRGWSM